MANILTAPESGIFFDGNTAGNAIVPVLTGNASGVAIKYNGYAGVEVNSSATGINYLDRFSVDGANGRLFSVTDEVTGTIFSVNDAAGLPIIEVESTSGFDKITIGEFGTNALVISGSNVGIGTNSPAVNLHVVEGEGTAPTFGSEVAVFQNNDNTSDNLGIGLIAGTSGNSFIHFGDADSNNQGAITFKNASNDLAFKTSATERMTIDSSGKVGIGTTAPTEALYVNGNILSNGVIKAFNTTAGVAQLEVGRDGTQYFEMKVSDPDCFITATQDSDSNGTHHFVLDRVFAGSGPNNFEIRKGGTAQVTVDTDGNVGIGTTSPSAKLHVVGDVIVSGNSSFQNRPTVNGTGVLLSGEGGGGTIENVVFTTGDQEISGVKNFSQTIKAGKITLSQNSFVTETGNFTLGATHKGATVFLQNSSPITITAPAQTAGYVTTFIAETQNTVSFATGAGISGLNSFAGASDMAGIFAQAQIIYKSSSGAFLGGNIV